MKIIKAFVSSCIILLYLGSASQALYVPPTPSESVYKYNGDFSMNSAGELPSKALKFGLRGDLYITTDPSKNGAIFSLTNVETSDGSNKPTWTPLPKEFQTYVTPFAIKSASTGLTNEIQLQQTENEPLWVKNIKRAVASNFQLNWAAITKNLKPKPFTFQSQETTLYGVCDVKYQVTPLDNVYEIVKSFNPDACDGATDEMKKSTETETELRLLVTKQGEILEVESEDLIARVDGQHKSLKVHQKIVRIGEPRPVSGEIQLSEFPQHIPLASSAAELKAEKASSIVRRKRDEASKRAVSNCASGASASAAALAGVTAFVPNPFTLIGTGIAAAIGAVCGIGIALD